MNKENATLSKLKSDLALAEKSITNPAIDKNPTLKKSLTEKIAKLKTSMAEHKEDGAPAKHVPSKTTSKPVKAVKAEKPVAKIGNSKGLKIGDTVTFFYKKTGKDRKGEVTYIHPTKGTATVKHSDGVSYPKVSTVTIVK